MTMLLSSLSPAAVTLSTSRGSVVTEVARQWDADFERSHKVETRVWTVRRRCFSEGEEGERLPKEALEPRQPVLGFVVTASRPVASRPSAGEETTEDARVIEDLQTVVIRVRRERERVGWRGRQWEMARRRPWLVGREWPE